jgi:hypothetical protein
MRLIMTTKVRANFTIEGPWSQRARSTPAHLSNQEISRHQCAEGAAGLARSWAGKKNKASARSTPSAVFLATTPSALFAFERPSFRGG